jgi:dienelactone hydrolase
MLFARHGVAALLYDKRDVGYEPGGTDLVDLRDLAGDALAAVALLKARNDIRDDQIGLWGISQGGMVAPIAAAQSSDVAYVIAVHELMLSPDAGGGEQLSAEVNRERRIALDYLDTMTGWLREQLGLAR